jgi:hypothetical protein
MDAITQETFEDSMYYGDEYDDPLPENMFSVDITDYRDTLWFDDATEDVRTGTTSPQTFSSHAAEALTKMWVLKITHGTSSTDHVSAASVNGIAMTRRQRNTDTAGEPGATEIWTLDANNIGASTMPTGVQTVSYTPGATTDDIHAVIETYASAFPLEVSDTDGITDGDPTDPSVTLNNTTPARKALSSGSLYGGGVAPSAFVPHSTHRTTHDHDLGAFYSEAFVLECPTKATTIACGGVAATDDVALSAILITPIVKSAPYIPQQGPTYPALLHY